MPIDAVLHSPTPSIVSIADSSNSDVKKCLQNAINDVLKIVDLDF